MEVRSTFRFDAKQVAGLVYFKLEGVAETLEVAPPAGELATFRQGEVEVTLELRKTPEGTESDDCLVVATVSREVVNDAYDAFSAHRDATLGAGGGVTAG